MASLLCEKGVHLLYNLHPRQMKGAFLAAQVPRILSLWFFATWCKLYTH